MWFVLQVLQSVGVKFKQALKKCLQIPQLLTFLWHLPAKEYDILIASDIHEVLSLVVPTSVYTTALKVDDIFVATNVLHGLHFLYQVTELFLRCIF